MAISFSARCAFILQKCIYIALIVFMMDVHGDVVFQPQSIFASGPRVTAFLLGTSSDINLTLSSVSPLNGTGRLPPPSCEEEYGGQWVLTREALGKTTLKVELSLNRSLQLCGNETDCCPEPLCVLETLRVSACQGNQTVATLLVQAQIYALVLPTGPVSDNKTIIPNQVYQPLGSCPCDLTAGTCDVRCCCDEDCSLDALQLFESQCFPGVFGGNITLAPDYECSVQSANNAPDWFPFLCVTSPPENSPFLGLFYQGATVTPKRSASFQAPILTAPAPSGGYRQGDPIFTADEKYFTIPQQSMVGQCVDSAPVAFLQNFEASCVTYLQSCPIGPPLLTSASELSVRVIDGRGGVVTVSVTFEPFLSLPAVQGCGRVTIALNYTFFWRGNGITDITVIQTVANVTLNPSIYLTSKFSATFVNGNITAQSNSGNPGYQVGRPVIGGSVSAGDNDAGTIQRMDISLWQPVGEGLCTSAGTKQVLFGENATAGCLLSLSVQDLARCSQLRETVHSTLAALVNATYVARKGNSNFSNLADWVNITFVPLNASSPAVSPAGTCVGVPSHLNILVITAVTGLVGGQPQTEIRAMEVSYAASTWRMECGGGNPAPCLNSTIQQYFALSSAVTFIHIPTQSGPPKTRFQINFTEYDCDRNDVCWPQLAYPLTRYYTGEPYSQSLAKGLILVFFFIAASVLGTPWRQIRQAWSSAIL
ncbi:tectonic-2 [Megalops cyprinoides]|uniref:tectonic-2 n=1 Tax=Megalops cyprinoides TaxID=118141 RepID=UPI0018656963|nr:tectonic-2 [Megalops cyprinoides]